MICQFVRVQTRSTHKKFEEESLGVLVIYLISQSTSSGVVGLIAGWTSLTCFFWDLVSWFLQFQCRLKGYSPDNYLRPHHSKRL